MTSGAPRRQRRTTPALPVEKITAHRNALVVPFRRGKRIKSAFAAGAFDADGTPLPETGMRTISRWAAPTPEVFAEALPEAGSLRGTWLFCGMASTQFGHLLTRSLGRLWAAGHVPPDTRLLFVSMMYSDTRHDFLTRFLRQLGLSHAYHILQEPALVDHLITAPDLFSEGTEGRATADFARWARGRAAPACDRRKMRKIYVTRGRLSPTLGRCLNENLLEQNLQAAGFEIVAPETLELEDQLRIYAEADVIVASEGSALHLVPFALRDSARLVVVQRRREVPMLIRNQIDSFTRAQVTYVDAIRDIFWPEERADNLSLVSLDFDRLRDALIAAQVLDPHSPWQTPTKAAERLSLQEGRGPEAIFLSDEERVSFLKQLRKDRRARRRTRMAA